METARLVFYLVFACFIVAQICSVFVVWRYGEYARPAFKAMKKRKMLLYCIPLFVSVPIAIVAYQILEEGLYDGFTSFWLVLGGVAASNALFYIFEARKAKQLGPAEAQ